jgi:hypothetical protein
MLVKERARHALLGAVIADAATMVSFLVPENNGFRFLLNFPYQNSLSPCSFYNVFNYNGVNVLIFLKSLSLYIGFMVQIKSKKS